VCPSTHPYRIPKDAWEDHSFMHADYFAANQPVFNDELLDD
jgi:hypothetical protein